EELGLNVINLAGTGLVTTLYGKGSGRTIALRADIDALPIKEENTFDYVSQNVGKMHACGHDGHIAVVLGAAFILSKFKDQINGNVKFIFQPGEEGLGGAKLMIDEGVMGEPPVDAIIAAHVSPLISTGGISVRKGPVMASPSEFNINISGKSGHAAQPNKAINPITIGAEVVRRFKEIIKPSDDPLKRAVLSVTCFNAGSAYNIIPDSAIIKGTIRTFDENIRMEIKEKMEQILYNETEKTGADYKLDIAYGYPPVINNDFIVERFINSAEKIISRHNIITDDDPSMLAEDFSYYAQLAPGAYFHLGCRNPESHQLQNLHSSRFNLDEECIKNGMELMAQFALDFLKGA
ncbi:MAG: M20 family metallopeptidase, partial [Bacillota bacterium]|nr:M20 family metallopeptidase [Bacillota bacterium]